VLSALIFVVAVPGIHGGVPWLIGSLGPRWGWTLAGTPGPWNWLLAAAPLTIAALMLGWLLRTSQAEIGKMPDRIPVGLQPARLMRTGPYSWSRHPMYATELLLWLGIGLVAGSPWVLAVAAGGVVLVVWLLLPAEEKALVREFGDEYRDYQRQVRALLGRTQSP
jgi:protein-S-isoprenylcysteine O-methyltransferase Ste14